MKKVMAGLGLQCALFIAGCGYTPSEISPERKIVLVRQLQSKPYGAFFEGLQPWSGYAMKNLAGVVSEDTGIIIEATSGNRAQHMQLIREARRNEQDIYVAGFSMGEREARDLARDCASEGIRIKKLFLIDGPDIGTIVGNHGMVVDIRGDDSIPYLFRRPGRYDERNLENPSVTKIRHYTVRAPHLDIPAFSRGIIAREIAEK